MDRPRISVGGILGRDPPCGLPSPHPTLVTPASFLFPGFTPATGGLLRERDLSRSAMHFNPIPAARANSGARSASLQPAPGAIVVSLFCYPDAPLPALLDAWADGDDAVVCVVPEGVATGALDRWTEGEVPHPGQSLTRGRLIARRRSFLAQDDYDRLLWASDVNLRARRGFVRPRAMGRAAICLERVCAVRRTPTR